MFYTTHLNFLTHEQVKCHGIRLDTLAIVVWPAGEREQRLKIQVTHSIKKEKSEEKFVCNLELREDSTDSEKWLEKFFPKYSPENARLIFVKNNLDVDRALEELGESERFFWPTNSKSSRFEVSQFGAKSKVKESNCPIFCFSKSNFFENLCVLKNYNFEDFHAYMKDLLNRTRKSDFPLYIMFPLKIEENKDEREYKFATKKFEKRKKFYFKRCKARQEAKVTIDKQIESEHQDAKLTTDKQIQSKHQDEIDVLFDDVKEILRVTEEEDSEELRRTVGELADIVERFRNEYGRNEE